jgi:hypothetical protein
VIGRVAIAALGLSLGCASTAAGQTAPSRIEIAVGPSLIGGASMSSVSATETQADNTPRALFVFSRDLKTSIGMEARIAYGVSPRLDVEAIGSYARPQLRVTTSSDVEGALPVTASESLQEFTVGGGASWFLVPRAASTRTLPFVAGSVAYARQLHEADTLATSGTVVDLGGGFKRVLTNSVGRKSAGIRVDLRARVRPQSFAADGQRHVAPMATASLFFRF